MRGEITNIERSFKDGLTSGFIAGEDGNTYHFRGSDWHESTGPQVGMAVHFFVEDGTASSVWRFEFRSDPRAQTVRGKVLSNDRKAMEGAIPADNGNRYRAIGLDWRDSDLPAKGRTVEFVADGDRARDVYRVASHLDYPKIKRSTAAILAFFLGMLGVHKFYMDYPGSGTTILLSTIAGFILWFFEIGALIHLIIGVIVIIEFFIYIGKSDEEFQDAYVADKRPWF